MHSLMLLYLILTACRPETAPQQRRPAEQAKGSFLMDGLWYYAREPGRRCYFEPVRHEQPLAEQLRLSLSTDQQSYYVGQPIRLSLTLRNEGNTPVRGCLALELGCGFVRIYYRRIPGPFRELLILDPSRIPRPDGTVGGGMGAGAPRSPRLLKPGAELVQQPTLAIDPEAGGFMLDQPGQYELKAVYRDVPDDLNGLLTSGVLTLRAEAPSGREEEALAAYTKGELAPLAQCPGGSPEIPQAIRTSARGFLEFYPDSVYADHVKRGLYHVLLRLYNDNRVTAEEREYVEEHRGEIIELVGFN